MNNKKGVSELVSYVLLIIIAVGLSVFVYNYISSYVPKDKPTCNQDVSLIVQDVSCVHGSPAGEIDISLLNKGLFKIDAAYARFGVRGRTVKQQLEQISQPANTIYLSTFIGNQGTGLKPGDTIVKQYTLPSSFALNAGEYEVEIEPAVFIGNDLALCPGSIITQPITCS